MPKTVTGFITCRASETIRDGMVVELDLSCWTTGAGEYTLERSLPQQAAR
jgi:hypothetical protein